MKINYTNEEMKGDLLDILRQMKQDNFKPDYIAGVTRGGMVPAIFLSHWFDCPLLTIRASYCDHNEDVNLNEIPNAKKILIIDDIVDSGKTMYQIQSEYSRKYTWKNWDKNIRTAALWLNVNQEQSSVNYIGREISRTEDQRWIIFPWEEWWKNNV